MRLSQVALDLALDFYGEDCDIHAMNDLSHAQSGELSFALSKKFSLALQNSKASAFLIPEELIEYLPKNASYLTCKDVSLDMTYATKLFAPLMIDDALEEPCIASNSFVDPRANLEKGSKIGENTMVMAGCYIGKNVSIGAHTVIHPNVTIYHDCKIGNNCIIHSGTVIGADGFGFSHTKTCEHVKIYQNGNTVIEDDVEIGASCAVDRAAFGSTVIKKGVKFDNFIHIAHNCEIGEYSLFVAQSGVGGSTKIGRNCVVSGQSAFTDHLDIAPFNTFTARSGITKSISESHKVFSGYPLMEHRRWRQLQSKISKLLS
jgi:UDP-3-O-[3-hydroxymyristoyl] glucosamine N-acyltransferase